MPTYQELLEQISKISEDIKAPGYAPEDDHIEYFDFSGINKRDAIDIISRIAQASLPRIGLEHLSVVSPKIIAAIQKLIGSKSLGALGFTKCKVSQQGAEGIAAALQENNTLTFLELSSNKLGANICPVVHALRNNKTLTRFVMHKEGASPEDIAYLTDALKNTNLVNFTIDDNGINDTGVKAIADFLLNNKTLQVIHLQNNGIGPVGAKVLGSALQQHPSIRTVDLGTNNIGDQGARHIARFIQNSRRFDIYLGHNNISNARPFIEVFTNNKFLKSSYINLSHNRFPLEAVANLKKIIGMHHRINLDIGSNKPPTPEEMQRIDATAVALLKSDLSASYDDMCAMMAQMRLITENAPLAAGNMSAVRSALETHRSTMQTLVQSLAAALHNIETPLHNGVPVVEQAPSAPKPLTVQRDRQREAAANSANATVRNNNVMHNNDNNRDERKVACG